ncbi:hypothetical protein FRC03_004396 [Tulasnella sp. 419]|nr:hypothetical protein FRC03_004396 [Tulasnella sp. 419]
MGNDGGSIPDRRDLVKSKPKAEQADKNNQTIAAWFFCALSKRPLQEPIVSCALGKLYNKDALIEYLLDKSMYGDGEEICGHIKSLKDVKTLRLTPNPAREANTSSGDTKKGLFICPLTLKEMSGTLKFVYLATCGCVFSAAGLKGVTSSSLPTPPSDTPPSETIESPVVKLEPCPQCTVPFSPTNDVRTINPGEEEQERMREKMLFAQAMAKASKSKSKKRKAATSEVSPEEPSDAPSKKAKQVTNHAQSAPSMSPAVSSIAKKVAEELSQEEKKRKANMSSAVASLYQSKKSTDTKETFLTMGTFTRYA